MGFQFCLPGWLKSCESFLRAGTNRARPSQSYLKNSDPSKLFLTHQNLFVQEKNNFSQMNFTFSKTRGPIQNNFWMCPKQLRMCPKQLWIFIRTKNQTSSMCLSQEINRIISKISNRISTITFYCSFYESLASLEDKIRKIIFFQVSIL